MTMVDRSNVMPTGINVDRAAWLAELQRLLAARADADTLFRFVDRAMTAAHDHALSDVTVYDENDPTSHPRDGQVVAVLAMYADYNDGEAPSWVTVSPDGGAVDAKAGDEWLWVPPPREGEQ